MFDDVLFEVWLLSLHITKGNLEKKLIWNHTHVYVRFYSIMFKSVTKFTIHVDFFQRSSVECAREKVRVWSCTPRRRGHDRHLGLFVIRSFIWPNVFATAKNIHRSQHRMPGLLTPLEIIVNFSRVSWAQTGILSSDSLKELERAQFKSNEKSARNESMKNILCALKKGWIFGNGEHGQARWWRKKGGWRVHSAGHHDRGLLRVSAQDSL